MVTLLKQGLSPPGSQGAQARCDSTTLYYPIAYLTLIAVPRD